MTDFQDFSKGKPPSGSNGSNNNNSSNNNNNNNSGTPSNPSNNNGNNPNTSNHPSNQNNVLFAKLAKNLSQIQDNDDDDENNPENFCINYNEKFKDADPALFRDELIDEVLAILISKDKPNAAIAGEAGVGKTRIVEEIARRIANSDPSIPKELRNTTVWELPLSGLMAGTMYRGALESKMQGFIQWAKEKDVVVFIDEIHQLFSSRDPSYQQIAQTIKPALARGDIHTIGATTQNETIHLLKDPAFNRRFHRVVVNELTNEQTVAILTKAAPSYISHHKGERIVISPLVYPHVVDIANNYTSQGNHRPDTALTLFDGTISSQIIEHHRRLKQFENNKRMQQVLAAAGVTVDEESLTQTAKRMASGVSIKESVDGDKLKRVLKERLVGQDDIIDIVVRQLVNDDRGLFPREKPLTFLFAGPSGVGKTALTKLAAKTITGIDPISINCTEYTSHESLNKIMGSPLGYIGSESAQEKPFDTLITNPYRYILLDEFEKGCREFKRIFMQVFDEGILRLNNGQVIDFSKATIIATTNAAHTDGTGSKAGFAMPDTTTSMSIASKRDMIDSMTKSGVFDVELLNRFGSDRILKFNALSYEQYKRIIAEEYERQAERILNKHSMLRLKRKLDDDELEKLAKDTYIDKLGARPAMEAVKDYINDNAK